MSAPVFKRLTRRPSRRADIDVEAWIASRKVCSLGIGLGLSLGNGGRGSASPVMPAGTVLLLADDSLPDGSTTFVDASPSAHTVTNTGGNVWYDQGVAYAGMGTSALFDGGSGHVLSIADHTDFDFGIGDFTIEGYASSTQVATLGMIAAKRDADGNAGTASWEVHFMNGSGPNGASPIQFGASSDGATNDITGGAGGGWPLGQYAANTVYHWCVQRRGNLFDLFLNGVPGPGSPHTSSAAIFHSSTPVTLGARNSAQFKLIGNQASIRIRKGHSTYDPAGFTPPTMPLFCPAVATPNPTVSLLHMDGANGSTVFADQMGHIFTAIGDAQISTTNPKFGTGCGLFDGTGDGIATPLSRNFCFNSGDFFLGKWFNFISVGGNQVLWDMRPGGGGSDSPLLYMSGGALTYYVGGDRITGAVQSAGPYAFVELSRVNGTTRLFVGGNQTGSPYADANFYPPAPLSYCIGGNGSFGPLNCRLDECIVRKGPGSGGHTANYTPPTGPFS